MLKFEVPYIRVVHYRVSQKKTKIFKSPYPSNFLLTLYEKTSHKKFLKKFLHLGVAHRPQSFGDHPHLRYNINYDNF